MKTILTLADIKKLSKNELINRLYNKYIEETLRYYREIRNDGKAHIGWYYTDIDFANKKIYIAYSHDRQKKGIVQNDYNSIQGIRLMTHGEVDIFVDFIDEIRQMDSISENSLIDVLNNWIQSLII